MTQLKPKHTFFCPDIRLNSLPEEESHHAIRVLRLKAGDHAYVINGKGSRALVEVTEASKKELQFKVLSIENEAEKSPHIQIAIAPTKNLDRFSFFLEKATEIGLQKVVPILTKNSERSQIKTDKLHKNLIAAVKQSGHLYVPEIEELLSIEQFLQNDQSSAKYIAYCGDEVEKIELKDVIKGGESVSILIGPEGDFTPEEIILAKENGYIPVSLGKSRLRTETAGIVACHIANLFA